MCWKCDTRLDALPADHVVVIQRDGRTALRTTPAALMREGRLAGFLTLEQVEFAFSDRPHFIPSCQVHPATCAA